MLALSRNPLLPFAHDPSRRGYHAVYRMDQPNLCPGCGRSHWLIGRLSAECAFCGTAIGLADHGMTGAGLFRRPHAPVEAPEAWA